MQKNRRCLLYCLLVVILAHTSLASAEVKSTPDAIVYSGTYPGWPWITATPSGTLLSVWREGTEHDYSPTGKVMLSHSVNEGLTWSDAVTVQDLPNVDDRNAAIVALSDTDWIVSYNTYTSSRVSRSVITRTNDGGASWSAPQQVSDLDARTRAAIVPLDNGNLILPFYLAPGNRSLAAISTNNGASWIVRSVPNTPGFVGDEWSLTQMPDGHLVGMLRNNAPTSDGTLYVTQSFDGGFNWTTPSPTTLRDTRYTSPPQIFLRNGEPWVLYDDARFVSVAVATTEDPQFINWDVANHIHAYQYRADGQPISDGGYPAGALIGDKLFVVDYAIDGSSRDIVGYSVDLPEPSSLALAIAGSVALCWKMFRWQPARKGIEPMTR